MWLRRCCGVLLVCAVMVGGLGVTAGAANYAVCLEEPMSETLDTFESVNLNGGIVSRVSGSLNTTVSANSTLSASENFYLDVQETVTINCSYAPAFASMDFGLIAPNGSFYYYNVTDGSTNKTIQVNERGYYTMAIRNNSAYSVSVTGYINY